MEPIDRTASRVLRLMLEQQPLTEAKVGFAWKVAAGTALARATAVTWSEGRLRVRARSEAWRSEVLRARPIIMERLKHLLGPEAVTTLLVSDDLLPGDRRG